jgi:hypothetical protein
MYQIARVCVNSHAVSWLRVSTQPTCENPIVTGFHTLGKKFAHGSSGGKHQPRDSSQKIRNPYFRPNDGSKLKIGDGPQYQRTYGSSLAAKPWVKSGQTMIQVTRFLAPPAKSTPWPCEQAPPIPMPIDDCVIAD